MIYIYLDVTDIMCYTRGVLLLLIGVYLHEQLIAMCYL